MATRGLSRRTRAISRAPTRARHDPYCWTSSLEQPPPGPHLCAVASAATRCTPGLPEDGQLASTFRRMSASDRCSGGRSPARLLSTDCGESKLGTLRACPISLSSTGVQSAVQWGLRRFEGATSGGTKTSTDTGVTTLVEAPIGRALAPLACTLYPVARNFDPAAPGWSSGLSTLLQQRCWKVPDSNPRAGRSEESEVIYA